ncbi:pre-mRNA-splicing factor rse1, variant 2 [Coprinopsis cinerea AmutBmut pab1-1]|nr:pre-mRNA-splicing factor rse1, variant 2 [Coprinopsis cinerea AmutBmut pab1-1]
MKIVTTFHPSSSVVSSVKCRLASRDLEHLVIAKLDRIDVYSLQPSGLQHECGIDVWGRVLCVKVLPIPGTDRSKLVLMTSHPDPELVFFSYRDNVEGGAQLKVTKSLSLYERSSRTAEFFNDLLIHPSGTLAIASCYVGKLRIVKLEGGDWVEDYDYTLPELNVLSIAFLPTEEYSIAILHVDLQSRVQLLAREIPESSDSDFSIRPSTVLNPTVISNKSIPFPTEYIPKLVAVPAGQYEEVDDDSTFLGGVLVIGGRKILLYELASEESREKQKGKAARLEKMLADSDKAQEARAKQAEREGRRRKPTASVVWPWDEVATWCVIDDSRFLISDVCGGLSLLGVDNVKTNGMTLLPLGMTSPPTSLTYLTNQVIFVGSHLGDSQLVQVSSTPNNQDGPMLDILPEIKTVARNMPAPSRDKGKGRASDEAMDVDDEDDDDISRGRIIKPEGSHLHVLHSFKNIAPINDAVVVDVEGNGQNEIVTCSGGYTSGSLNIVRSGAEYHEAATLPGVCNVNSLWTIKSNFEDTIHSHIVASTHDRTLLFRIKDDGRNTTFTLLDSTAARDFITDQPTVALANVRKRVSVERKSVYRDCNWVVQVTDNVVNLLEHDVVLGGFNKRASWSPPSSVAPRPVEIVAADINPTQVVLALSGGRLVVLRHNEEGTAFELVAEKNTLREISAVSCQAADTKTPYTKVFLVGYWEQVAEADTDRDTVVEILELERRSNPGSGTPSLTCLVKVSKKYVPALPRSLLLYSFGVPDSEPTNLKPNSQPTHLFCGLADGSVAHFVVWKDGGLNVTDSKIVPLGTTPVKFSACVVDGKRCVLAVGNRASIFSYERKRMAHSPVMLKDLNAAYPLNTHTFPTSFILANHQGLTIGSVKEIGKISIRTIPLGYDNPQRIVHIPLLRAYAVACATYTPVRVGDAEAFKGSLKLLDDLTFKQLSQYNCDSDEVISALTTFTEEISGKETPLLVVGTSSSSQARLLVFSVASSEACQELTLITSLEVNGQHVNSLCVMGNYVLAAVDCAVFSYKFKGSSDDTDSQSSELKEVGEWNHNYIVRSLGSFNNSLVIGDIASSVSLVNVNKGQFTPIARDYAPLFPYALEALSENALIGGNDASNLFTFSLGQGGMGRKVLERDGSFFLGDLATKFIRGAFHNPTSSGVSSPKLGTDFCRWTQVQ